MVSPHTNTHISAPPGDVHTTRITYEMKPNPNQLLPAANHAHLLLFRPNKVPTPSRRRPPAAGCAIHRCQVYAPPYNPLPFPGNRRHQRLSLMSFMSRRGTPYHAMTRVLRSVRFPRLHRPHRSTGQRSCEGPATTRPNRDTSQPVSASRILAHLEAIRAHRSCEAAHDA